MDGLPRLPSQLLPPRFTSLMRLKQRCLESRKFGAVLWAAAIVICLECTFSHGAIYEPPQVGFSVDDLERELSTDAVVYSRQLSSDSMSSRFGSAEFPSDESEMPDNPLEFVKSWLPTGNSSSGTSNSTTGGGVLSNGVMCALNTTTTILENVLVGQLTEHQPVSLPDPPGTNLIRPPRTV